MSGNGDTKEEAYSNLRINFEKFKKEHSSIPRPGTGLPIEFADSDEIEKYYEISKDFLNKIFEINRDECFISDESSIWDFYFGENKDILFEKIKKTYGVDVKNIEKGNLVKIFQKIEKKN